jgi:hypothetical protein
VEHVRGRSMVRRFPQAGNNSRRTNYAMQKKNLTLQRPILAPLLAVATSNENCSFEPEKKLFRLDARTVSHQTVIASDNSMTRDDDRQGIGSVGATHRLESTRNADSLCQHFIRNGRSIANFPKLGPDLLLEIGSNGIEPAMELDKPAVQITIQFIDNMPIARHRLHNLYPVAVTLNPRKEFLLSLCRNADLAHASIRRSNVNRSNLRIERGPIDFFHDPTHGDRKEGR